jgi:8-oxo-dGTP pyrophosphatase MutT (NUDIX family)/GNAT superfamily N-acetyltransferase
VAKKPHCDPGKFWNARHEACEELPADIQELAEEADRLSARAKTAEEHFTAMKAHAAVGDAAIHAGFDDFGDEHKGKFTDEWTAGQKLKKPLKKFEVDGVIQIASVAPFNDEGKLLFGRRRDDKRWTLPGGHMEEGEDPLHAAVRELIEETGLRPSAMEDLGTGPVVGKDGKKLMIHCFRATVTGKPSNAADPDQEVSEWRWVDVDDGLPDEIAANLSARKNVTLNLLGLQSDEEQDDLAKAEEFAKNWNEGKTTYVNEGPSGWTAGPGDLTRKDLARLDPQTFAHLPGRNKEHELFARNKYGRMSPQKWTAFMRSVKAKGVVNPIQIFKEKDGRVHIWEGNHRIRAAIQAGVKEVPFEISYMGNSQRTGLVYDPEKGLTKADDKGAHRVMYNITDRPNFALDPNFEPEDNSISMNPRQGQKGIYLTDDPEKWVNGHNYVRPYLAEFHVHPSALNVEGNVGRWNGETFLPAAHFDKIKLNRVIPLDAHVREKYGAHGWIEEHHGTKFDTGEPIASRPIYPFRGYKYTGPDVRQMTPEQHEQHRVRWHQYMKANRGIDMDASEGLAKMALADIKPGAETARPGSWGPKPIAGEKWFDYSHILPAEAQREAKLYVQHGPGARPKWNTLNAVVEHNRWGRWNAIGNVLGSHDIAGKTMHVGVSDLDEDFRGKGIGRAMYEALMAHGKNVLGAHTVAGGTHSSMASTVHQALADKHGMNYQPVDNPNYQPVTSYNDDGEPYDDDSPRPSDKKYGSYSYALKSELSKAEDEIERLMHHPDPLERRMALKLDGVSSNHLARALVHPDTAVARQALYHPQLDAHCPPGSLRRAAQREAPERGSRQQPRRPPASDRAAQHGEGVPERAPRSDADEDRAAPGFRRVGRARAVRGPRGPGSEDRASGAPERAGRSPRHRTPGSPGRAARQGPCQARQPRCASPARVPEAPGSVSDGGEARASPRCVHEPVGPAGSDRDEPPRRHHSPIGRSRRAGPGEPPGRFPRERQAPRHRVGEPRARGQECSVQGSPRPSSAACGASAPGR